VTRPSTAAAAPAAARAPRPRGLQVSIGQHSDKGCKAVNQDFHGARLPDEPQRSLKGVVVALADGISSSDVSHIASAAAVHALVDDYYCTSDAWSVKRSAQCVLAAINSWLHAQTQRGPHRFDRDRGHVCTLSALVLKSATAHLLHVGDARIFRVQGRALEQLTEDHRVRLSAQESQLSRALGVQPQVEIDYLALPVEAGDVFVLATDGVYEHVRPGFVTEAITANADDLDEAARRIVAEALRAGSRDNLTVQIVRVDQPADPEAGEVSERRAALRLPPVLQARDVLDGHEILRELHSSSRSHVYLAVDRRDGRRVVLKTPSIDLQGDGAYLDRFMLEEWIARRIDSPHVLRAVADDGPPREHLFVAMEYVEGCTLAQWMVDHPRPELVLVRDIVEQIARGLQAFHRMEMLHQDLRPENIMIDGHGTVKIIDFGSVRVAGLAEIAAPAAGADILGTLSYTAPEYFLGEPGTVRSDLFSLGVITYQMLCGRLPYGTRVASVRSRAALNKLQYLSARDDHSAFPAWVDAVLRRAVHPNPLKRPEVLTEFVHDLRHPGAADLAPRGVPLSERHPVQFWRGTALVLALTVVLLLGWIQSMR
jgi:serine/threonine protein phosphatase PrpC/aminoglycoside phosphotransferase